MTWQPIATAPLDGSEVLLAVPGFRRPLIGSYTNTQHIEHGRLTYDNQSWHLGGLWPLLSQEQAKPTHWMPLPALPGVIEAAPEAARAEQAPPQTSVSDAGPALHAAPRPDRAEL